MKDQFDRVLGHALGKQLQAVAQTEMSSLAGSPVNAAGQEVEDVSGRKSGQLTQVVNASVDEYFEKYKQDPLLLSMSAPVVSDSQAIYLLDRLDQLTSLAACNLGIRIQAERFFRVIGEPVGWTPAENAPITDELVEFGFAERFVDDAGTSRARLTGLGRDIARLSADGGTMVHYVENTKRRRKED
ncbi:hypothetical protein AB0C15_24380 [Micromonospora sp. NPDC048835]|uniref:hypothetical protein n=1 Tax=Micromonospora sp. NPDC048835 TaxID=3155147 RepID=UPI00340ED8FF